MDVFDECLALPQRIRLSVKNPADALQLRMADDLLDVIAEGSTFGPSAGDDALEGIVRTIGELEDVARFVEHERLIHIGFDVHALFNVEAACGSEIVGHAEGT